MTQFPISVVIPLYNQESTVLRAVASVLQQLGPSDELIVVDDGSTDGGGQQLQTVRDDRFKLFSRDNHGVSAARNFGVRIACHPHVAFLDADDFWMDGVVEKFRWMITCVPNGVFYAIGHTRRMPAARETATATGNNWILQSLNFIDFIELYRRRDIVTSSSVCIKRSRFDQVHGFPVDIKSGEDVYLWLRLAKMGTVVVNFSRLVEVQGREPSFNSPERDVPFHFEWFTNPKNLKEFTPAQRKSLRRFLESKALRAAAVARIQNRQNQVLELLKIFGGSKSLVGLGINTLSMTSRSLLLVAFRLRRVLEMHRQS